MTTYGLTPEGFVVKPYTASVDDVTAAQKAAFGASLKNEDPAEPLTQLNGIFCTAVAEVWQVAQALASSRDPDKAEAAALESLCALTGTLRATPRHSTVTMTLTGTPGTLVAAARVISVQGAGDKFETTADATITAVAAWAGVTTYSLGDRVTNGGKVYVCVVDGNSDASGGPTGTGDAIIDDEVTWRYVGDGTAAVDVAAQSQAYEAIQGISGTITVIETPVGGWVSARNLLDATLGQSQELDPALRIRRLSELRGPAMGPVDTIRAAVLKVDGVIACDVFPNITDLTDGDGVPPHSVEVLVRGGADADIRAALWANVSEGIRTFGGVAGSVVDSMGNTQAVNFSRPTEVPIYVAVTLVKLATKYPADGDAQVKAAIVAEGDLSVHGYDAFNDAYFAAARSVAGVFRITSLFVGAAPAPVTSTVAITSRQLAVFDTSRVSVATSNGTP